MYTGSEDGTVKIWDMRCARHGSAGPARLPGAAAAAASRRRHTNRSARSRRVPFLLVRAGARAASATTSAGRPSTPACFTQTRCGLFSCSFFPCLCLFGAPFCVNPIAAGSVVRCMRLRVCERACYVPKRPRDRTRTRREERAPSAAWRERACAAPPPPARPPAHTTRRPARSIFETSSGRADLGRPQRQHPRVGPRQELVQVAAARAGGGCAVADGRTH